MANLDTMAIAEQITDQMIPRLATIAMSPEEAEDGDIIIREFNKIAAGMLMEEPGLELPGAPAPIPFDEQNLTQGLMLFSEGIFLAVVRCGEMGITGDVKKHLLQNLAMEVYGQSKQIMVSTYGQEHTPELQFSHEQQIQLIHQGSESVLMYFIGEYEKEHGPIVIEQPEEDLFPQQALPPLGDAMPQIAQQTARPKSAPVTSAPPQGPTPHDKYGAVALLLTALPAEQRNRILQNFNPEEKELIAFYSYPQHLEQNLDLSCVDQHLKRFKEMLDQGGPALRSAAYRGIARLVREHSVEKLLSCVADERPVVKQYLQAHGNAQADHPLAGHAVRGRHFADLLPGRVEEILHQYLVRRLSA